MQVQDVAAERRLCGQPGAVFIGGKSGWAVPRHDPGGLVTDSYESDQQTIVACQNDEHG
jgi:hypothetical protein